MFSSQAVLCLITIYLTIKMSLPGYNYQKTSFLLFFWKTVLNCFEHSVLDFKPTPVGIL